MPYSGAMTFATAPSSSPSQPSAAGSEDNALRFHRNGTFRVLQVADIQDGPHVHPDTLRLIGAAIRESKPDLVVFTGDQIRGYDAAYIDTFLRRRGEQPGLQVRFITRLEAALHGTPSRVAEAERLGRPAPPIDELLDETRQKVRDTFNGFLSPLIDAGVPFAATYGNHDFQCGILADEQDDIYREFPGCMNPKADTTTTPDHNAAPNPLAAEPGTFALPIHSSDGQRIAMSVTLINSGDYADKPEENDAAYSAYVRNSRGLDLADSDGYGTPSPKALSWLTTVQKELGRRNGDGAAVPSIAFQHIAPPEFYDCLKEVPAWTPYAVEGVRGHAGRCYALDTSVCRPGSHLGDQIGCADVNVGEVEALRSAGGYFGLYVGHDHKNSFVGHVHGLDLGYCPTCGFESYGPESRNRAIRLFEFREDDPAGYSTRLLTWGELVGRYSSDELRVFIENHLVTGASSLRNQLRRPAVLATVGIAFMLALRKVIASNRRHLDR